MVALIGGVTAIVGGFTSQQVHGGQNGVRFTPVPRAHQAEAVRFLNDSFFATPTFLINNRPLVGAHPIENFRTAID